jgi:hypothetical protein
MWSIVWGVNISATGKLNLLKDCKRFFVPFSRLLLSESSHTFEH